MEKTITPINPYIIRAFYEWIEDNDGIAEILIDATITGVDVPLNFVQNGQILLNIRSSAVNGLEITNEAISFNTRFNQVDTHIYIPIAAVVLIQDRLSQQMMPLPQIETKPVAEPVPAEEKPNSPLSVVK